MAREIRYRPEIDGLRAIAVTSVFIYHLGSVFLGVDWLPGGFLGVDIFFVISGYLISNIILSGLAQGTFSLTDFYRRRIRRILPVFFVVLIVSLPFMWSLLLPEETQAFARSLVFSIFFVSNIWFFSSDPYWAEGLSRPFLHTWSLGVEEQFYLLFPGFFLLVHRLGKSRVLQVFLVVFMASLGYAHFESGHNLQAAFFLLPARIWELSAGILLAISEREERWKINFAPPLATFLSCLGLLLIVLPMYLYSGDTRHPSLWTVLPVLGVVLVIAFARNNLWITKILSLKPLVALGLISYGLYLWHYPALVFAQRLIDTPNFTTAGLLVLSCLALSTLSYFLVEQPARKKSAISFLHLATILCGCLLVLIPFLIFVSQEGLRSRYPDFLISQESMPEPVSNYEWTSAGDSPAGNIILVGDSHMMAIAPQLKTLALANRFNFSASTERGCQLIVDTRRVLRSNRQPTHCTEDLQAERMAFLRAAPRSFVVIGGRLPLILEEKAFDNGMGGYEKRMIHFVQNPEATLGNRSQRKQYIAEKYRETIEAIASMGHKVVLLYPVPEVGWHVPQKLVSLVEGDWTSAREIVNASPIETDYDVFRARTKSAYELLDSIDNESVYRVYPERLFCNLDARSKCATHSEEHVYYRDEHHPSAYGASLIAQAIIDVVTVTVSKPKKS